MLAHDHSALATLASWKLSTHVSEYEAQVSMGYYCPQQGQIGVSRRESGFSVAGLYAS